ncbi:AraR, Transcriptional regulator, GntR family with LacI sensor [Thermobacillus xylanilyticus]|jgi:GntR family transcriptional regulator, arabinose operon transcriptional repressor|uniref:AraR, Transcriptional regulator, GntR family with LacI sensor n=1 Tax=Thermobacillus xylanilyticus TaxID=76633 RepID=A0ABN7RLD8_THEXY|nr:substrate-binding domain-containing protein [Thermobacillus xylanilyticus]CAG5077145.1 AraR, Transcriptional regulator, GntR family with LacI sensor [Thermobacillus xylanilyticus]
MNSDRQPLYMKIQDHFKQLILKGELKENDKIPSEKELMEQFDVSRITVANALIQLAKDGWIYRIPGRGSFVSGHIDKRLLSQAAARPEFGPGSWSSSDSERQVSTKVIGLIMPVLVDYFALRLIHGINRVIGDSPYRLQIVQTFNSIEREKEAIADFIEKGAAGLIIFPSDAETYNEDILALKLNGYPFVLVDRYFQGVETNVVHSDGFLGGKLAVDYLWSLGHRDIAICSDSPLSTITVEDRINGYLEELKNKKAMINPALILTDFTVDYDGVDTRHPLYRFVKNRMATAYITLNGRLGLHIHAICRQIGLRVPEDVSILTFDDPSPELEQFGFFSHISQSEHEMGEKAARILLDLLESPLAQEPKYHKIVLEPVLVKRRSTGPAPAQ